MAGEMADGAIHMVTAVKRIRTLAATGAHAQSRDKPTQAAIEASANFGDDLAIKTTSEQSVGRKTATRSKVGVCVARMCFMWWEDSGPDILTRPMSFEIPIPPDRIPSGV